MRFNLSLVIPILWLMAGCRTYQSYHATPVDTATILSELVTSRRPATSADSGAGMRTTLSLHQAASWMSAHNPDLRELRAAYDGLAARANVRTPLPNPTIEVGVARGFRVAETEESRTQPFVVLGFAIPFGPRLARTDDLHAAEAEAARVELVARHRELYLQLRGAFLRCALLRRRLQVHEALISEAGRVRKLAVRLTEIGQTSALDVGLMDLDAGQLRLGHNELMAELAAGRAELASLTGVSEQRFGDLPVADVATVRMPGIDELRGLLAENHPELVPLQAHYEVAERALRLEVTNQYPDLQIAVEGEQETGERKREFGLAAGIEVPLFDRNQQGITEAVQARRAARVRYEAAAGRALAELEALADQLALVRKRQHIVDQELLPQAQANLASARRLLEAGQLDALRFLELQRGRRELEIASLDAQVTRLDVELALERLTGTPLLRRR